MNEENKIKIICRAVVAPRRGIYLAWSLVILYHIQIQLWPAAGSQGPTVWILWCSQLCSALEGHSWSMPSQKDLMQFCLEGKHAVLAPLTFDCESVWSTVLHEFNSSCLLSSYAKVAKSCWAVCTLFLRELKKIQRAVRFCPYKIKKIKIKKKDVFLTFLAT